MNDDFNAATTRLATGDILRIENAKDQSIAVVRGMVWVTQERDRRDVFLSDSETFVFDQPGTALVQAVSETWLIAFVDETAELMANLAASSAAAQLPTDTTQRVKAIVDSVQKWLWRANGRYELAGVGERRLRDLGFESSFASTEAARASWRA
ncbi:MAG: DUF2917 domain-containing protein [Burkholderiaceae bacterium]